MAKATKPATRSPAKKSRAEKSPARRSPAKTTAGTKPSAPTTSAVRSSTAAVRGTVEDYARQFTDWRGIAIGRIFELVRQIAPAATGSIKWGQPVFESNGPMIFVKGASAYVTLGFWRGAEMADPEGLLEGDGERMRHVKLKSDALPGPALQHFIRQALDLNVKKGDPTKAR